MIESMVVVTIIGIMAAATMPAMTEMVMASRQQGVSVDLMLLARRARVEAMFGGYANMIVFDQNGGAFDGAAVWLTGMTPSCTHATGLNYGPDPLTGVNFPSGWQPLFPSPIGSVSIGSAGMATHRVFGRMELPAGTVRNLVSICYHPSGRTWASIAANNQPGWQVSSAMLFIRRTVGGAPRGVDRQLVFPPSGTARLR